MPNTPSSPSSFVLMKSVLAWLGSAEISSSRRRQGGFVLPIALLVVLLLSLISATIVTRSFNRTQQAAGERASQVSDAGAERIVDRVRAKINYLMDASTRGGDRLPLGRPSSDLLLSCLLNDGSPAPVNAVTCPNQDPANGVLGFTLPDETRIPANSFSRPTPAWYIDNGDSITAYMIVMQTTDATGTIRVWEGPSDAAKASNLMVRNLPFLAQVPTDGCIAAANTGSPVDVTNSWFRAADGRTVKPIQAFVMTIPKNTTGADQVGFSAFQYQVDRYRTGLSDFGAYFRYELEMSAGANFRWNGKMYSESNIWMFGSDRGPTEVFLISDSDSCVFRPSSRSLISSALEIISGSIRDDSLETNANTTIHPWRLDNIRGNRVAFENGIDSVQNGANIDNLRVNPAILLTRSVSAPNGSVNFATDTFDESTFNASRDANWVTTDLVAGRAGEQPRLATLGDGAERPVPPYVDDTYRSDNRCGPAPNYGVGEPLPGGCTNIGNSISAAQPQFTSDTIIVAGDPESVGLDGYWEKRAFSDGARIIVGQRFNLSPGHPENPDIPLAIEVPAASAINALSPLASLDDLVAERGAGYEATADFGARGVNSANLMSAFNAAGAFDARVDLNANGVLDQLELAAQATAIYESGEIAPRFCVSSMVNATSDSPVPNNMVFTTTGVTGGPMATALDRLVTISSDPLGAFPPRQDANLPRPNPRLIPYGDFSNLNRALNAGNASLADRSYVATAGCMLGMLAWNISSGTGATNLSPENGLPAGTDFNADGNDRLYGNDGILGNELDSNTDGIVDESLLRFEPVLNTPIYNSGEFSFTDLFVTDLGGLTARELVVRLLGPDGIPYVEGSTVGGGLYSGGGPDNATGTEGILPSLWGPDGDPTTGDDNLFTLAYSQAVDLFLREAFFGLDFRPGGGALVAAAADPLLGRDETPGTNDPEELPGVTDFINLVLTDPSFDFLDTLPNPGTTILQNAAQNTDFTDLLMDPTNPLQFNPDFFGNRVNGANDVVTLRDYFEGQDETLGTADDRSAITAIFGGDSTIASGLALTVSNTNAGTRVGVRETEIFNGRERQSVRVLDLDIAELDGNGLLTTSSGIIYAFREDAVREDAIARPVGEFFDNAGVGSLSVDIGTTDYTRWNVATNAACQPNDFANEATCVYLNPYNGGDPRLTTVDTNIPAMGGITPKVVDGLGDPLRRAHGFRLSNGAQIRPVNSSSPTGLAFISDNPVYISAPFNLHTQEEFTETLNADWNNFYNRDTLNPAFQTQGTGGDEWRPAEIIADAISIVSANFVPPALPTALAPGAGGALNSHLGGNVTDVPNVASTYPGTPANTLVANSHEILRIPGVEGGYGYGGPQRGGASAPASGIPRLDAAGNINPAANSTVNALIVSGTVPSGAGHYSGGLHNFPRLLEHWGGTNGVTRQTLQMAGSFIQLNFSKYATAPFDQDRWPTSAILSGANIPPGDLNLRVERINYYMPPNRDWGYDVALQYVRSAPVSERFDIPDDTRDDYLVDLDLEDPYINVLCDALPAGASVTCP